MFLLNSNITIGKVVLNFINQVNIDSSLKNKTQKATIKIPKKVFVRNADFTVTPLSDVIKNGDKVVIQLGYDGNLKTEYIGYVRSVSPTVPMEVDCEDEMYVLKRKTISAKVFRGGKISDVIKYIAPGYEYAILDSKLGGTFAIEGGVSATKVLEKIEEVYGLRSFFAIKDDKPLLVVGLVNLSGVLGADGLKPVKYKLNQNVITNNLELERKEDMEIKIDARSRQANGKTLKAKFKGDKDGDTKKFAIPGLTQNELENEAKRLYQNSKVDRFDGSITTFGIPFIKPGMSAYISTEEYEINETTNVAEGVQIDFGVNGFRREITLGEKVA